MQNKEKFMEIIDIKDGFKFKTVQNKTFAFLGGDDNKAFCPFCYNQISFELDKCLFCNKNIPQIIYYHAEDQTWIASGNE